MAGRGQRFAEAGYKEPKPLIPINGVPMIRRVLDSLNAPTNSEFVFVTRKYDDEAHNWALNKALKDFILEKDFIGHTVTIDYVTEGAACTCLLAKEYIDQGEPLCVFDCDLIYHWGTLWWEFVKDHSIDGGTACFKDDNPACSFLVEDYRGHVIRTAEKKVISDNRMVGSHYWALAADFVAAAEYYIKNNLRTNNEFYISPIWNYLIDVGRTIKPFHSLREMYSPVGTPQDLENYLGSAKVN
jgi:NDP-sugar pyrophosphorylase family protein